MCKVQRLFREEVQPSGWKRSPLNSSDDIVYSAWGHAAVHKRTGRKLTSPIEYKVTYAMGKDTFVQYAFDLYGIKFTDAEATELIRKFFVAYPDLKTYHSMVGKKMKQRNYICQTALGYKMKPMRYAEAINGPTQGTGAECMRLAIHLLFKRDKRSAKMIRNSIHDALYLIVPEVDKDYWGDLLQVAMVDAWNEIRKSSEFKWHDIPMKADLMFGYSMGDLEEGFSGGGQALTVDEMRESLDRNKNKAKVK